jgi:hypothetical protein
LAVDGDKEKTSFRNPLWDVVWQSLASILHGLASVAESFPSARVFDGKGKARKAWCPHRAEPRGKAQCADRATWRREDTPALPG